MGYHKERRWRPRIRLLFFYGLRQDNFTLFTYLCKITPSPKRCGQTSHAFHSKRHLTQPLRRTVIGANLFQLSLTNHQSSFNHQSPIGKLNRLLGIWMYVANFTAIQPFPFQISVTRTDKQTDGSHHMTFLEQVIIRHKSCSQRARLSFKSRQYTHSGSAESQWESCDIYNTAAVDCVVSSRLFHSRIAQHNNSRSEIFRLWPVIPHVYNEVQKSFWINNPLWGPNVICQSYRA